MSEQPNVQAYKKMSDVAIRLAQLLLPATSVEIKALFEVRPANDIVRALQAAPVNERAMAFLKTSLAQVRLPIAKAPPGLPIPADSMGPPPSRQVSSGPGTQEGTQPSSPGPSQAGQSTRTAHPGTSSRAIGAHSTAARHGQGGPPPVRSTRASVSNVSSKEATDSRGPPSATPENASSKVRQYDQHCVFGKETALQFERSATKGSNSSTVNFSIAKAKGSSCKEGVNWTDAIRLMLTPQEVQLVAAVMLGLMPTVRFSGHGSDNKKWFSVEETSGEYAGSVRFTIAHDSDRRHVNVGSSDIALALGVFFRTLEEQLGIADPLITPTLRRAADLYTKKQAVQSPDGRRSQRTAA